MRACVVLLTLLHLGAWAAPGLFVSPTRPESSAFAVPVDGEWLYLGEAVPGARRLADHEAGSYYYLFYGEEPPAGVQVAASFPDAHLLRSTGPLPGYPGGELLLLHPLPGLWRPPGVLQDTPPEPFGGGWIDPGIVALIDVEHYLDHLEELTAIPTRFSFSPGCAQAAELISTTLGAWGYAPYYHSFDLNGAGTISIWDISAPDEDTVFGVGLMAVKTEDGGETWHAMEQTGGYGTRAVHFLDTDRGWVGGQRTMLATQDGGDSWEVVDHGFPSSIRDINFSDDDNGYAVGWGFISLTDDGGETWREADAPDVGDMLGIDVLGSVGIAAGVGGLVLRSVDGGRTWDAVDSGVSYNLYGVSFGDSDDVWVVGAAGTIIHSGDAGLTWSPQQSGFTQYIYDIRFVDDLHGYCVGDNRHIFETTDGGETWIVVQGSDRNRFLCLDVLDDQTLWIGGGQPPFAYRSTDGGQTLVGGEIDTEESLIWRNVVCELPSSGDGPALLVVGHYDSISEDPHNLAPGADDNGSGVAACLEVARACRGLTFDTPVRVVFFSGEEQGLIGSSYYVDDLEEGEVGGVINLDMYAYRDDENYDLEAFTRDDSLWLSGSFSEGCDYTPAFTVETNNPEWYRSDHASFWRAGIPAIHIGEYDGTEIYPYYHTTEDTIDKLDMIQGMSGARAAVAAVMQLVPRQGQAEGLEAAYAFPNPFRPGEGHTAVTFRGLPPDTDLSIYDAAGSLIFEVGNLQDEYAWSVENESGRNLASGVYIYRLAAPGEEKVGKLAVIR
jgi:photosystem II stability/assembly factor-like uncharacterized protein